MSVMFVLSFMFYTSGSYSESRGNNESVEVPLF